MPRTSMTETFALELDGQTIPVKSIKGGETSAEVINEPAGASYFVMKHIGQPKYESIDIQADFCGPGLLLEFIGAAWGMGYQSKDGTLIRVDTDGKPVWRRRFDSALITKTAIPKLDIALREPAYLTVRLAPESVRDMAPSAGSTLPPFQPTGQFLPSDFRLEIEGLDCTNVSTIDSFTVVNTAVTDDVGEARDAMREPGKFEFPNLRITIPAVSATSWRDWFHDFVVVGNNGETAEKTGTLSLEQRCSRRSDFTTLASSGFPTHQRARESRRRASSRNFTASGWSSLAGLRQRPSLLPGPRPCL